jgi:hypothetical protein
MDKHLRVTESWVEKEYSLGNTVGKRNMMGKARDRYLP